MSVLYPSSEIRLEGGRLSASFEIENRSDETWRRLEGFAIGHQILDADTELLVVDGERIPLGSDLRPGERVRVAVSIEIPQEPGRYWIYISPMREGVCWYYEAGWRFFVVEAVVENGQVRLERVRQTNIRVVNWRRFLRSSLRACVLPWRSIWENRRLIRSMVVRDISRRYSGSFGGLFWTVLNPAMLMLTYFFVFGIVLQARLGSDASRSSFVLYFLAGMLPWLPFSEAVARAPVVILEHRSFVKKLVFPVETLPVNLVVAGLVTEALALVLFLVFVFISRGSISPTLVWLPALAIPQILFTMGVCWFAAALSVYVRDVVQVSGLVLTLWFFLTPICYPETSLPPEVRLILAKNPLYVLVKGYRAILLEGQAPVLNSLWKLWLLSLATAIIGHAWFHKLKKSFPDVI